MFCGGFIKRMNPNPKTRKHRKHKGFIKFVKASGESFSIQTRSKGNVS